MPGAVDIVVNKTHPWGPEDHDRGLLNGSEEIVYCLAKALAARGHSVTVACTLHGMARKVDGVYYMSRMGYCRDYLPSDGNVLIAFKCPEMMEYSGYSKRFFWTADPAVLTPIQRMCCTEMLGISKWHMRELQGLNVGMEKIGYVYPGFDPVKLGRAPKREKMQCLYASSHDRGLVQLLDVWPRIMAEIPEARLFVTYSDSSYRAYPPEGVIFTGRLSAKAMTELYQSSDFLLYPCTGGERFCFTVLKAQYYGCVPITTQMMALSETNRHGVSVKKIENFLDKVISHMQSPIKIKQIRHKCNNIEFDGWDDVACKWEEKILGGEEKHSPSSKRARKRNQSQLA